MTAVLRVQGGGWQRDPWWQLPLESRPQGSLPDKEVRRDVRRVSREHFSPPTYSLVSFVGSLPIPGSNIGSQLGFWKVLERHGTLDKGAGRRRGSNSLFSFPLLCLGVSFFFHLFFFFSFFWCFLSQWNRTGEHVLVCVYRSWGVTGNSVGKSCGKVDQGQILGRLSRADVSE